MVLNMKTGKLSNIASLDHVYPPHDPHGIKVEFNFEGQDRPWSTLERLRYEM
jgi:uncharacterized protein YwbE